MATTFDEEEDVEHETFRETLRHSPDTLAAYLALRRALPRRVRNRLAKEPSFSIVVSVPSANWVVPVRDAFVDVAGGGDDLDYEHQRPRHALRTGRRLYVARDGSERSNGRPDLSGLGIPSYLGRGGSVIAIAADLALLPSQAVAAADASVEVKALSPRDLALVVRLVTRARRVPAISPRTAASLDPQDIAIAVRPGSDVGSCLRRIESLVASRTRRDGGATVGLEGLAGYGAAYEWGMDLVADLRRHRLDPSSPPRAVLVRSMLLSGPPGVGKTMYASALARSAGVPLVATSVAAWQVSGGGYLNDVLRAMRAAFDEAREKARVSCLSILFVDELDSMPNRTTLVGPNEPWWTSLTNALLTLTELSSPARDGVVLLGATNDHRRIDPALLRSGRFDRVIRLELPDEAQLALILRSILGDDLPDADLRSLTVAAPPSSGADAARWVRDARAAARAKGRPLVWSDLQEQLFPKEDRSYGFLKMAALHEAAHAVASIVLGRPRLASISLFESASSAAHCTFEHDPEDVSDRAALEREAVVLLAGRAADAHFGSVGGGSGGSTRSDLAMATSLVAALRVSYGMSGGLSYLAPPEQAAELLKTDVGLRTAVDVDLAELYARSRNVVREHADAIKALADALVARRALSAEEVKDVIHPFRTCRTAVEPS